MRGPGTAVAIALLTGAIAAAGCGLGPGQGLGGIHLTVTRDYGRTPMFERDVGGVTESDDVMRVLERNADIATRYGGGFVQAIDGVEGQERFGRSSDWFFYVDGVESTVGAADFPLRGGESIWWDYRDWGAAISVPAVVGSWPQPFTGGYDGSRHRVVVECRGGGAACATVRSRLESTGVSPAHGSPADAIRVLVGPWVRLRDDQAAAQVDAGPQRSGVFAEFDAGGRVLLALNEQSDVRRRLGPDAGLVAATRREAEPPVWLVTGTDRQGVEAAAGLLDAKSLRDRYAVAVDEGRQTGLPLR